MKWVSKTLGNLFIGVIVENMENAQEMDRKNVSTSIDSLGGTKEDSVAEEKEEALHQEAEA